MRIAIIAVLAALLLPAVASAHDSGSIQHKNHYLRAKTFKLGGSPGCDLVEKKCKGKKTTPKNIRAYFNTMRRMIAPPPPVVPVAAVEPADSYSSAETAPSTPTSAPTPSVPSSGAGGAEQFAQCESGSSGGYSAYNPSSGAYGKYQIIPSTWAAHCSDLGQDPSGQDQCAARVYDAQGSGAWAQCGG